MTILVLSANLLCIYGRILDQGRAAALEPVTSLLLGAALLIGGSVLRRRLHGSHKKLIPVVEARSSKKDPASGSLQSDLELSYSEVKQAVGADHPQGPR